MTTLQDFVRETLREIVKGVREAQQLSEVGGQVPTQQSKLECFTSPIRMIAAGRHEKAAGDFTQRLRVSFELCAL